MFGRGQHSHGFSNLLRMAKGNGMQGIPASHPPKGGSAGNRKPNNAATQKHMDAKNSPRGGGPRAYDRIMNGRKSQKLGDSFEGRIARGSAGTEGRQIHHQTEITKKHETPGHISVGPHRSGKSSHKISRSSGSTGMSPEVSGRPGVPAHQSVINRSGSSKGRGVSYGRRQKMAHSIQF